MGPLVDPVPEFEEVSPAVDVAPVRHRRHRPHPIAAIRHMGGGIAAVSVKELRGRMRGRRAFVILTFYLFLLAGFAWMMDLLAEASASASAVNMGGRPNPNASADIGQTIFAGLLMLETLQVVFLAPAATAGAISLEREKQTLGLLVTTPISSLAIVLGKLLSALTYVFLLIAASIPLTAIVFVFGGVGPEDVVRGYIVLFVAALGLGAFGLCCSSLVKRTQAATAISIFGVLTITVGSLFLLFFWGILARDDSGRGSGPINGRAPEIIAYVNPFLAQMDVLCGAEGVGGDWCGVLSFLVPGVNAGALPTDPGLNPVPLPAPAFPGNGKGQVVGDPVLGVAPAGDVTAFGVVHDSFWPRSVVTWLILTVLFVLISIQFVSPTRRWHIHRRRTRSPSPEAV